MQIQKTKIQFKLLHDHFTFRTVLAVYRTTDEKGKKQFLTEAGWKRLTPGTEIDHAIVIEEWEMDELSSLAQTLYDFGIVPKEHCNKGHLEDMRKIVSHTLGVDL